MNCSCVEDYHATVGTWPAEDGKDRAIEFAEGRGSLHEAGELARYRLAGSPQVAEAVTGVCDSNCRKLAPFLALLLLVVFASSMEQMPALMALLR